jgi:hypothetical protein
MAVSICWAYMAQRDNSQKKRTSTKGSGRRYKVVKKPARQALRIYAGDKLTIVERLTVTETGLHVAK